MNGTQENKAREALLKMQLTEFKRQIAYKNHVTAAEWVLQYGLPYRVALDYLKADHTGKVKINPCYPAPGYIKSRLLTIKLKDLDFERWTTIQDDGSSITDIKAFKTPKPDIYELIKANNADMMPTWNLSTHEGLQEWEKLFAHYFIGYDIGSMTAFDIFGHIDVTPAELEERKQYYMGVIGRYNTAADYLTEAPPYKPEYEDIYTDWEFWIDWGMNIREGNI